MYEQNLITQAQYDQAMSEHLEVQEKSAYTSKMYDNAYYVEYAIYDVVTKMLRVEKLERYHCQPQRDGVQAAHRRLQHLHLAGPGGPGGRAGRGDQLGQIPRYALRLRPHLQDLAGDGQYIQLVQPQAAAAVMDWHTGELVAIIGGRAAATQRKQLNRAYQSKMPVGSSLKPLSVYGPAFDLGYSPGTL
jgi:penicillin-binding protein 1A